jgi:hypothetical protein
MTALAQDHGRPHPAAFQLDADLFGHRFDLHRFLVQETHVAPCPVLGAQADPVEDQIALGPGQHPARRVVVVQPVEGNQSHRAALDGMAGGGYGNLPDIAAVVILDRIVDDLVEQFDRQHVEVVEQVPMSPGAHRRVIDCDEAFGRKLGLGDL